MVAIVVSVAAVVSSVVIKSYEFLSFENTESKDFLFSLF